MLVAAGNERGDKLVADFSGLATVCAGVVAIALRRLRWCFLFWFLSREVFLPLQRYNPQNCWFFRRFYPLHGYRL